MDLLKVNKTLIKSKLWSKMNINFSTLMNEKWTFAYFNLEDAKLKGGVVQKSFR